jgi:hypothetical protein
MTMQPLPKGWATRERIADALTRYEDVVLPQREITRMLDQERNPGGLVKRLRRRWRLWRTRNVLTIGRR